MRKPDPEAIYTEDTDDWAVDTSRCDSDGCPNEATEEIAGRQPRHYCRAHYDYWISRTLR